MLDLLLILIGLCRLFLRMNCVVSHDHSQGFWTVYGGSRCRHRGCPGRTCGSHRIADSGRYGSREMGVRRVQAVVRAATYR